MKPWLWGLSLAFVAQDLAAAILYHSPPGLINNLLTILQPEISHHGPTQTLQWFPTTSA